MQGLEDFISGNIWQFIFSGVVVLAQLYIATKINPIKKIVEKLESGFDRQWKVIDEVRERLNILQGEHNIKSCMGGKK